MWRVDTGAKGWNTWFPCFERRLEDYFSSNYFITTLGHDRLVFNRGNAERLGCRRHYGALAIRPVSGWCTLGERDMVSEVNMRTSVRNAVHLALVVGTAACTQAQEGIPEIPGEMNARVVVQTSSGAPVPGADVAFQLAPTAQDSTHAPLMCQTDAQGACSYRMAAYPIGWHRILVTANPPSGSGLGAAQVDDSAYFGRDVRPGELPLQIFTIVLQP